MYPARGRRPASSQSTERRPLLRSRDSSKYAGKKLRQINCFDLIHRIKRDIEDLCDTPLNSKELESPKLIFLISPLQEKYERLDNLALVYCLLVCRIHFLDQQATPSIYSLADSRAALCEIVATKIMRKIYDDDPDSNSTIFHLAHMLNASFSPFQGASPEILQYHSRKDTLEHASGMPAGNALELAIISNAKRLIRSMPCQRVIDAIWTGEIIYSPTSFIDLLPDHYNRQPITMHDPINAPLLNHYRLIVPRIRAGLEYAHFITLFLSYMAVVSTMQPDRVNGWEIWLAIYASGFALDKIATVLEHGMGVYVRNLWNSIDLCFCAVFAVYLILRIMDACISTTKYYAESLNVLACGAVILFPRLAFLVVSSSSLVLGLRAMFVKFVFLIFLAAWCFSGFLVAFFLLSSGTYSLSRIAEYMIWTTFGMNGTAIAEAKNFHPIIGPLLWISYAFLSSTLLLSTVVSILSYSFFSVAEDKTAEIMFKKAVNTLEGIKSDAIFLYQPPLNLPAFLILFPLSFVVTAKRFHEINVLAATVLNAPILLSIGIWERRRTLFGRSSWLPMYTVITRILNVTTAHHVLKTVFDVPPGYENEIGENGSSIQDFDDEDRRGRSSSPINRRGRGGTAQQYRSGSRPSPLTRLYGKPSVSGEDVAALTRRLENLEEALARIEDAVKIASGLT